MVIMPQNVGTDQSLNFSPATLTVAAGTTVTFEDQDSQSGAPHNVHWLTQPSGGGAKDSPVTMTAGQSFTVTLTTPGTYTYDCSIHPAWMKGTITVKAS
jgi:plastocyanin